jgi:hypothetical protein
MFVDRETWLEPVNALLARSFLADGSRIHAAETPVSLAERRGVSDQDGNGTPHSPRRL